MIILLILLILTCKQPGGGASGTRDRPGERLLIVHLIFVRDGFLLSETAVAALNSIRVRPTLQQPGVKKHLNN